MSKLINLRFARFVKAILDIAFAAMVFACVGLVLWIIFSPLIVNQTDVIGSASVPVLIGSGEEPQFEVFPINQTKDDVHASFVEDAEGTLRLETSSIFLILIANATKLIVGIGLAYIFNLLRGILQNILDGHPFTSGNALRIRRLGYGVLLMGILRPLVEHIAATEILNRLQDTSPTLTPGPTFNIEVILFSLLILLLAYIWDYGLELAQDSALTV
jgi:hypothetical protein